MVKTKILLVEDDKSLREIYGVRLYSEGYDIISAGDGEEALAMAIKERPTLIISDVMMPKISGFDMLDILRSTTETKGIKVIMMTALSSEDQRARGEALGADRYLVKSQVGIEDVVRTVHEVLGDAPVSGMTNVAAPVVPTYNTPVSFESVAPSGPETADSALPQPTAPFSTNRPAGLGDRVIHPLTSSESPVDFNAMMNAELSTPPQAVETVLQAAPAPAAPMAAPMEPPVVPAPAPVAPTYANDPTSTLPPDMPALTAPSPIAPTEPPMQPPVPATMSFEETPYAPNPTMPQAPTTEQSYDTNETPLVVPPRPTPGV